MICAKSADNSLKLMPRASILTRLPMEESDYRFQRFGPLEKNRQDFTGLLVGVVLNVVSAFWSKVVLF